MVKALTILRAYFLTRCDEVVAVESIPLGPQAADTVWWRLHYTTVVEWWRFGETPPPLKFGARVLVKPRWEDVRPLRIGLIADRVAATRIDAPKSESNSAGSDSHPATNTTLGEEIRTSVQTNDGD